MLWTCATVKALICVASMELMLVVVRLSICVLVRPGICVAWSTSGVKTWNDLFTKQYLVGSSGAGSQMETIPAMLNKLFGTKIKVISGYRGGNEVYLAMERGEVSGRCGGLIPAS